MPSTSASAELHPEFYFDDSLVVIQVENTLFRVHKYQLVKSETFSNMFGMPSGPAKEPEEGASREHPIVLEGVKASDFAALIKVLYASWYSVKGLESDSKIIIPAFRLAHMWDFPEVRNHLLPLVKDSLGCVDRIVLARELGMSEWLAPAFLELCQREELPTREEATKLGMDSILMLSRLREQFRPSPSGPGLGTGNYCSGCVGMSRQGGTLSVTPCDRCGSDLYGSYYRYTVAQSSAAQPSSNPRLEDEVKKWIEGGCMTE